MPSKKRFITTLPDRPVTVIQLSVLSELLDIDPGSVDEEDAASFEAWALEKMAFECYRPWLQNPALTGKALQKWRMNLHFNDYTGDVPLACRECTDMDIPQDRTFADAWEEEDEAVWAAGGKAVRVNMPKARLIHMDQIRPVRDVELERESGSKYRQPDEIEALFTPARQALLQKLRDIPQDFDLEQYTTPEALQAAWPAELPARA